jgi:acetyl/propionyl-CoA carboxylase alpha subunit
MNIHTVAIYAPSDIKAPYTTLADSSVALPSAADFRNIPLLTSIAKEESVDAVHPGYGFLSENPEFAAHLRSETISFIGPSPEAMRLLGNKSRAKELAHSVQVPTPPTLSLLGLQGNAITEAIVSFGESSKYPLMIKASAGGGGRGMRVVHSRESIQSELETVLRESAKVFGNSEVFVEKFLSPARHVEVQVLGDQTGKVIALGTRDCSVQRSNQKVVEEAPAPNLPKEVTAALCAAAVRLGEAAKYTCAGTVEFLVTEDFSFYLLEMNCRLQVEHPVTEMIIGRDLVRDQILLTEGLSLLQLGLTETPQPNGHAIEARLCAEAFEDTAILSTGDITLCSLPERSPHATIRSDFGYSIGSTVSTDFDSLLGKIITHSPTRSGAITSLRDAVHRTAIGGVRTNRDVILSVLESDPFLECTHSVASSSTLFPSKALRQRNLQRASVIVSALRPLLASAFQTELLGWSLFVPLAYPWRFCCNGKDFFTQTTLTRPSPQQSKHYIREATVFITGECEEHQHTVQIVDLFRDASLPASDNLPRLPLATGAVKYLEEHFPFTLEGLTHSISSAAHCEIWVHLPFGSYQIKHAPPKVKNTGSGSAANTGAVLSPLPGTITSFSVTVGSSVEEGQQVATLESMKMEHPVRSPTSGEVTGLTTSLGASVSAGEVLLTISPVQKR